MMPNGKSWETRSLRWEVIVIEPAGHKTAALALAGFDAAIEGSGIILATDLLALL